MAREHIEFIQSQQLYWQTCRYQHGVKMKLLSVDDQTNALTGIYRYPASWESPSPHWLDCDEEFFILQGELMINNQLYAEGYYGYLPRGFLRERVLVNQETVLIRFIDGNPSLIESTAPSVSERTPAIERINTFDMKWDKGIHDEKLVHLDFGRKILRLDPNTKAKTFLYMVSPQTYPDAWSGPREYHPTVEEAYCVTGTLSGNLGVMRTGAYFWRPAMIPHGPYGSRTGCVLLIRFVGGEHINHWSQEHYPFEFSPQYQPVVPEKLKKYTREEWKAEPF